jgi:putative DNA methylase
LSSIVPFSLKDAPALIERLLPVQKLSAEAYKEQMAGSGKTLTPLGSYWKGRKPLILNKACVLGCLLPAGENVQRDLEVFEKLMAMDDESFTVRIKRKIRPRDILASLSIANISDYFDIDPPGILPNSSPVDWTTALYEGVRVAWRDDLSSIDKRRLEAQLLPPVPYRRRVEESDRAEEVGPAVHDHIWASVNDHLGTSAYSFPELIEQLGIMRFGHRPKLGDTFCGSGQIPFEAARLGCDVHASDLNPVACLLTWGAFNIIGGTTDERLQIQAEQEVLIETVRREIDALEIETDGQGWKGKVYLYCAEAICPQTGWLVPLIPSLIISQPRTGPQNNVIAELIPDATTKRYEIHIRDHADEEELELAKLGTVRSDGRGTDPYMVHSVNGSEYRTKISTLRGDYRRPDGSNGNKLRLWGKSDFRPLVSDILRERLYCVQWIRTRPGGRDEYEFRAATTDDLQRESIVEEFVECHIQEWQARGWIPDMRIEPGAETTRLFRERGWTYWHHLFNPRQLLIAGLVSQHASTATQFGLTQLTNWNSKLCRWNVASGGGGSVQDTFYSQALNSLLTYGCRGYSICSGLIRTIGKQHTIGPDISLSISNGPAAAIEDSADLFITDPPYGDAVNYDEILDFFIAWLRTNPPREFADWVWDSRRSLAIKGDGEDFRRGMVAAYKHMTECMPDNGIQVIMFTHQSGSIWADMANIVWASGLQVTAAWYVVTETDSALREGSYVKGTVLLVLRKRAGTQKISRDDLAWEIQEEVEEQVASLTGLNQQARGLYRDENVFEDADIQMAGYAAALRVLTKYATIDGRDMTTEASRPRVKGEKTFIDSLIEFAVATANQCLVPAGIEKSHWDKLSGAERFYLKMLDLEARGSKTLDNYQNFAKAFKVRDFNTFLESSKANSARLKSASEFGRAEMGESSEFYESVLRASLYAMMEIEKNVDGADVLAHLRLNVPNYYGDTTQRDLVVELAGYMAKQLESIRPEEASAARVLRELVKNERLG